MGKIDRHEHRECKERPSKTIHGKSSLGEYDYTGQVNEEDSPEGQGKRVYMNNGFGKIEKIECGTFQDGQLGPNGIRTIRHLLHKWVLTLIGEFDDKSNLKNGVVYFQKGTPTNTSTPLAEESSDILATCIEQVYTMKLNRLLTYDKDTGSIETVMNYESVEKIFSNMISSPSDLSQTGTSCDTYPDISTDISSNSEISKGTIIYPFIFTSNGFTSHDA